MISKISSLSRIFWLPKSYVPLINFMYHSNSANEHLYLLIVLTRSILALNRRLGSQGLIYKVGHLSLQKEILIRTQVDHCLRILSLVERFVLVTSQLLYAA